MGKIRLGTKLNKLGWDIEVFQPKGEPCPWSLKIYKKIPAKELGDDSVAEWIRQCNGRYVITAYLDPNRDLSVAEREERIESALRWELTKRYGYIKRYSFLKELETVVGKVTPLVLKKEVRKAAVQNSNETALRAEKQALKV